MTSSERSSENPPRAIIVAGPNGAGKSTTSRFLLGGEMNIYINPDLIATGMSPVDPESVSFATGRMVLTRIRELVALKENFAFETTLSGKTYLNLINTMKATGYRVSLIFLWVESADLAVRRVQERVKAGGHNIPEETIRRRYDAGLRNFFDMYQDAVYEWFFYDNSSSDFKLLARKTANRISIVDDEAWEQIIGEGGHINNE